MNLSQLEREPLTSGRREAAADRRALACIPALWTRLVDLKGRPMAAVRALSPERDIADFPRVVQLRWLGHRWADVGAGTSGDGVIDLVRWLGGNCDRSKAVEFIEDVLRELN